MPIAPLLIASIFFLTPLTLLSEVQTDFDGDGVSDHALIVIESDKSLRWLTKDPSALTFNEQATFGKSGDHIVLARWRGRSVPEIGVVSKGVTRRSVAWKILDENGIQRSQEFGKIGDLLISGADFDGNGYSDAAVAFLSGRSVHWRIWPDMFAPQGGNAASILKFRFGRSGDRLFYASLDGSNDWIGRIGKTNSGRVLMQLKNIMTSEVRTFDGFGRFVVGAARPRPFPIKTSSGIDILGFEIAAASSTTLIFTNIDGSEISRRTIPGEAVSVVGEFNSTPGEELSVVSSDSWSLLDPLTGNLTPTEGRKGIPVDFINVNTLTRNSGNNNSGGGGNTGGETPTQGNPGSSCSKVSSWPGSHIYKTVGSNHFTDVRRNTIGVIIKPGGSGPFPNCVTALDSKGNLVASLGLYARGNGWAARYYAGIGCGAATPFNGSKVASIARAKSGSSSVYMNFGSVCYGPIDASRCIGSGQC